MVKTVMLRDDVYKAVINRQTELLNKGKEMNIQEIVAEAILAGLELVGKNSRIE